MSMVVDAFRFGSGGAIDPTLWAACSIKRLVDSYAGALMSVRRSSDNALADIGMQMDGTLDAAALLAHVGGGDGYVATWYDQTGNGNDFAQATSSKQFKVAASGSYLGHLLPDGTDDYMESVNSSTASIAKVTIAVACDITALGAGSRSLICFGDVTGNAGGEIWTYGPTSRWNVTITAAGGFAGGFGDYFIREYAGLLSTGDAVAMALLDLSVATANRAKLYIDGTLATPTHDGGNGTLAGTFASRPYWLGARNASSVQPTDTPFYSVLIYEADKTANAAAIAALLAP